MHIIPITTRVFFPPKDDLFGILDQSLPRLTERDIVVVTSKVVAIGEGRCIPAGTKAEKEVLIAKEADYLARFSEGRRSLFSIKGHTVVGSAGIDDSNGNGYWILWPKQPMKSAKRIWDFLRARDRLQRLGVIITDSYSTPMRLGTLGISIGFFGFHPVVRHIGKKDIFGRKFKFSRTNLADGIASAAVLTMGETNERKPVAVVREVPLLRFVPYDTSRELLIRPKEDIYYPILKPLYDSKQKAKSNSYAQTRRR